MSANNIISFNKTRANW